MATSFREPFFLRGRKSVLLRAILISLVLAGLSSAAAWIIMGAYCAALRYPTAMRQVFGNWIGLPLVLSMTSFAILIVGPLNHWRRRECLWTGPAVPLSITNSIPFGIILYGEGHPILNGKLPAVGMATVMAIFAVMPCFPLLSLIRRRWQDAGTLLLTMLGSSVVGLFVFLLIRSGTQARYDIRFGVHAVLLNAGLVSLWFAVVCIPWGIPFWWPQEPEIAGTKLP